MRWSQFRDNNAAAALRGQGFEEWPRSVPAETVLEAATAVLAADDERATRKGTVHQGEQVAWADIDPLLGLALYGKLVHQQLEHHGGSGGRSCPTCAAGDRISHTSLVDPVTGRLGVTATELHAEVRLMVLADLNGP